MKKLLENAIVGMGWGFPATLLCMIVFGGYNESMRELLVWAGASALYGILSGTMFRGTLEWPLPVTLAVHCGGCLAVTIGAAVLNGYVAGAASVVPILLAFAAVYALVYAGCVWMMKRSEKEINEALKEQ